MNYMKLCIINIISVCIILLVPISTYSQQIISQEKQAYEITTSKTNASINIEYNSLKKADANLNHKLDLLERQIKSQKERNDDLITTAQFLIGIATLLMFVGTLTAIYEFLQIKKKFSEETKEFKKKSKNAFTQTKKQLRSFEEDLENFERVARLTHMLNTNNYDPDIFYSDLSALSQRNFNLSYTLVMRINEHYSNHFDEDILELVDIIRNKA